MHPIDFNAAEKLGWEIAPRFEARKGNRVLRGTAAELSNLIAEHEQRAGMHAEQRVSVLHRERHAPIRQLVRLLDKTEREYRRHWNEYSDTGGNHHTRMLALDRATKMRKRQVEMFEELLSHPKEALLENDDFLELQGRLRGA